MRTNLLKLIIKYGFSVRLFNLLCRKNKVTKAQRKNLKLIELKLQAWSQVERELLTT